MAGHDPSRAAGAGVFVGRETEVQVLARAAVAARAGRGGVVTVSGEAGIGKSRLVAEAVGHARGLGIRVAWGHARAVAAVPMGPWREVLGALGRPLAPGEVEGSGASGRAVVFEAVAERLAAAVDAAPALVVLEDLHWADEATVLQLEWLRPTLVRLPLLVVATTRQPLAGLGRPDHDLRLGGLSEQEVAALVGAVAGGDGGPAPEEIVRRTGGNPFFVLEVARAPGNAIPTSVSAVPCRRGR